MRKHAERVEAGHEPPCDVWFIDGLHTGFGPYLDLRNAHRAAHNHTLVFADDCTNRFPAVRHAWHVLMDEGRLRGAPGHVINSNGESDGSSGRVTQGVPSPGQPGLNKSDSFKNRPLKAVIGVKGWCTGWFVKPANESSCYAGCYAGMRTIRASYEAKYNKSIGRTHVHVA